MDILDFYRGTLSVRRLGVLVRQLKANSGLARAINDGEPPWGRLEHLTADMWTLWAKKDHPVRAELEARARVAEKTAKIIGLNERRKRTQGLE